MNNPSPTVGVLVPRSALPYVRMLIEILESNEPLSKQAAKSALRAYLELARGVDKKPE